MDVSYDEAGAFLDELADSLPPEFYKELNGGIVLSSETKHRDDVPGNLMMMGCYRRDFMGRSIEIYYGSFVQVYGNAPKQVVFDELRNVLLHEFTHHLESLAGEKGLERKDEEQLEEYLRRLRPDNM